MKRSSPKPQTLKSSPCEANARTGDRSSPKQRNTPLSVQEANDRLLPFGLKLASDHPAGTVTCTTIIKVQCGAGHCTTTMYGHIRERGCPECNAFWGERLLFVLLRHYLAGPNDWRKKTVWGLDPNDPELSLVFDCYSESRRVVIENHSEYHKWGSNVVFGKNQISNEERVRRDILKIPECGLHEDGPLKGWKAGVVWFELPRLIRIKRQRGDYLPQVIKEFKELAEELDLRLKGVADITAEDVCRFIAKDILTDVKPGFELVGEWCGRAREHQWKHTCGAQFSALLSEVEVSIIDRTGCPFCDRTGHPGKWLDFLDRSEEHGYQLDKTNRMEIITEHQIVPLRCIAHPEAEVRSSTRSQLYQWFSSLSDHSSVSMLPPCTECAKIHLIQSEQRRFVRNQKERDYLGARLKSYGHTMVTCLPSSVRDPATHKIKAQKNVIRCDDCGHERSVFVPQALQKADKRGAIGCPVCRPLARGPKRKVHETRETMLISV